VLGTQGSYSIPIQGYIRASPAAPILHSPISGRLVSGVCASSDAAVLPLERKEGIMTQVSPLAPALAVMVLLTAPLAYGQQSSIASPSSDASSSADNGALQEIVVSAQRRAQTVQDVAISMDAFSGDQLAKLGMNDVQDIAANTPNVRFASFYGAGRPDVSIRGISIGDLFTDFEQSPVGFYNDDVYIGSRSGQLAQMFDLDRVEVLRGPQGTLFGRNTTAGAVNFIAKKPGDSFETDGSISYGRWNEIDFQAGVTLPLSDVLSIRFSGIKRQRDGWVFDHVADAPQGRLDDVDNWGARTIVSFHPSSQMEWLLNVHGTANHTTTPVVFGDLGTTGANAPNVYTGYLNPSGWNQVASGQPAYENVNTHGVSLTGNMNFGNLKLTSISDYDQVDYAEAEDDSGSPINVATAVQSSYVRQFSEELRLSAKQGPLDWVAGLYWYTDKLQQEYLETSFTDPIFYGSGLSEIAVNYPEQASHNYAEFGDLRYSFADQWTLDVGARYTVESKHLHGEAFRAFPPDPTFTQSIGGPGQADSNFNNRWSAPTGRVALEYKPTSDILSYVSWNRGFKSGGYNGLAFNSASELAPYNPEKDDTYELGVKTTWFDGRLTANADVFYNKLKDMQVLDVEIVDAFAYFYVRNAATATTKGAEFELKASPGGGLTASLGIGLLNTRYGTFVLPDGANYSGEELTNAPKFTGNAAIQDSFTVFEGTLAPNLNFSYTAFRWTDNPHRPGIDDIPAYGVLNGNIPWTTSDGRWEYSLWARNLTDKHYYLQTVGNGAVAYGTALSYHADPRTYGVSFAWHIK
jgi:iron complex outermembrane receptor protein